MATAFDIDSSSSDEDFFFHETAIQPYRFEPSFSQEEIETRRRESEAVEVTHEGGEGTGVMPTSRTNDKFWCTCDMCRLMPTDDECVCCHEVPQSQAIVDRFDPPAQQPFAIDEAESVDPEVQECGQKCVTQHPDFEAHLNEGVLDTYFRSHKYNWKSFPKPRGPGGTLINAQYRLVAYRFILDWLLQGDRLGRKKRIPLPSCIVTVIRRKYPASDDEYTGFKFAELPTV